MRLNISNSFAAPLNCVVFWFHAAFYSSKKYQYTSSRVRRLSSDRGRFVSRKTNSFNHTAGLEAILDVFCVNRFLHRGTPNPFIEEFVEVAGSTVTRDARARVLQRRDPSCSCKLRSLIYFHNPGRVVLDDSILQHIGMKFDVHRVQRPLVYVLARYPSHDRLQIVKFVSDWHKCIVSAPNWIA